MLKKIYPLIGCLLLFACEPYTPSANNVFSDFEQIDGQCKATSKTGKAFINCIYPQYDIVLQKQNFEYKDILQKTYEQQLTIADDWDRGAIAPSIADSMLKNSTDKFYTTIKQRKHYRDANPPEPGIFAILNTIDHAADIVDSNREIKCLRNNRHDPINAQQCGPSAEDKYYECLELHDEYECEIFRQEAGISR